MNQLATQRYEPITGKQFVTLMDQLQLHAGIKIESPQIVIESNVRGRMDTLGLDSISSYMALFDDSMNARAEWLALIDLLTVKETRFFRQVEALQGLAKYIEGKIASETLEQEFSFWSAGCATGQELYSIAMVVEQILSAHAPWFEWHGIGTDISFNAVNKAQLGRYPESDIQTIPVSYRHPYVSKIGEDEWAISDSILARTHFFHSNLMHVSSAPFADFNVIFCQNVLIYFEHDMQRRIIDQLVDRLQTGGLLILGAGEDVRWTHSKMRRAEWPGVSAYIKLEV